MRTRIIEAVTQADHGRVQARCGFGRGKEDQVSFNRRLRMKDGVTWSSPGQGNPDIVGYAGPIDPEVGVIGAWDKAGNLLGCVVNFACHATTNPGGISANWIYYLEKTVRGSFGAEVPVVFLQGACSDVTQVDNLSPKANPSPEKWCQLVGGRVGAEAVKVLLSMEPGSQVPLAARSDTLQIKRRAPRPERVQAARDLVQKKGQNANGTEWVLAKELVLLDALLQRDPVATVEVQAIQVGPAVFLANPAELFRPVRAGPEAGEPVSIHVPRGASQRLRRIRADRGGFQSTGWGIRDPADRSAISSPAPDAGSLKPGPRVGSQINPPARFLNDLTGPAIQRAVVLRERAA